jgi:hypothetical protein
MAVSTFLEGDMLASSAVAYAQVEQSKANCQFLGEYQLIPFYNFISFPPFSDIPFSTF